MRKQLFTAAIAAALMLAVAAGVHAATIHGTLVNGTTGQPIDGTVIVVNPAGGMAQEKEVKAAAGRFTVEGLDAGAGLYLLRCDYAGVMYTEIVRFEGEETAHATVTVYEQAPSFDGIHVLVPHLAVAAADGQLQIEVLYELHNHVEPPGTVAALDQQFLVYLPEDRIDIMRSFVSHNDIPLDRFPVPTDEPGVYRIDYPVRPGDTQVGLSYSVPYGDSTYTLRYTLKHGIDDMTVYAINSNMTVSSSTLKLGPGESVHGMTAYSLKNVAAGTTFELTFRGGDPITTAPGQEDNPHSAAATTGQSTVVTLPNRMDNPSTLLMVGILLVMLALVGMATRGAVNPLAERERLKSFYETLLMRMARLDDLNDAGAVAYDVYKVKRAELKNQIASVMYQLQADEAAGTGKGGGKRRRSAPNVAGKERTAP